MEIRSVNIDGELEWTQSKSDLLCVLKSRFEDLRAGVDDPIQDTWLSDYCHHWGETQFYRTTGDWKKDPRKLGGWTWYPGRSEYLLREKMLVDEYGRTVNLPVLVDEAILSPYITDRVPRIYNKNRGYWWSRKRKWKEAQARRNWWWNLYKKRNRKSSYSHYYRQKNVRQEMVSGSNPEHAPYVRPKRRPAKLNPWDIESCRHMDISWKNVKVKKQWMLNIS